MTDPVNVREWKLKALTDIWTGDADGKGEWLITTGLLGSIRWWFEVLVRGLDGSACDPTVDGLRCPDKDGRRCVVCELFGCTGWARKFRFQVLDENDNVEQDRIEKGQTVRFVFTELRPMWDEEWALLDLTLRLIADYGAIGGRTVFKPSDEPGLADLGLDDFEDKNGRVVVRWSRRELPLQSGDVLLKVGDVDISSKVDLEAAIRDKEHGSPVKVRFQRGGEQQEKELWYGKRHHQDFGLIAITDAPLQPQITEEQLRQHCSRWRRVDHNDFAWASLENFWYVKDRYLARQGQKQSSFNTVLGRKVDKSVKEKKGKRLVRWSDFLEDQNDEIAKWLAGRQQESKKVFSFKEPEEARRTFGFVKPGLIDFNEMRRRLGQVWQDFQASELQEGLDILQGLLRNVGKGGTL